MIRFLVDVDASTQVAHRVHMERLRPHHVHQPPDPTAIDAAIAGLDRAAAVDFAVAITRAVSAAVGRHIVETIESERSRLESDAKKRQSYEPLRSPLRIRYFDRSDCHDFIAHTLFDVHDAISNYERTVFIFAENHQETAGIIASIDAKPMATVVIASDPSRGLHVTCLPPRPPPWTRSDLLCHETLV